MTGQRWLRDPEIRGHLARAGAVVYATLAAKATGLSSEALDILAGVMRSEVVGKGTNVKVRAALGILDTAARLHDGVNIEERLAAVEATAARGQT